MHGRILQKETKGTKDLIYLRAKRGPPLTISLVSRPSRRNRSAVGQKADYETAITASTWPRFKLKL